MSESITVTRKGAATGGYDVQGNPVVAADVSTELLIEAFAPRGSDETAEASGPRSISGGVVYAFPGTVFDAADVLTIRGEAWQVEGEQGVWDFLYSSGSRGVEVAVRRAT